MPVFSTDSRKPQYNFIPIVVMLNIYFVLWPQNLEVPLYQRLMASVLKLVVSTEGILKICSLLEKKSLKGAIAD